MHTHFILFPLLLHMVMCLLYIVSYYQLIQFLCEELKPDEKVIVFVGKKVT